MKIPRMWSSTLRRCILAQLVFLTAFAIFNSTASAASIKCVATMPGSEVVRALSGSKRYGLHVAPAALNAIDAKVSYCRSAIVTGAIDAETPAAFNRFLSDAPFLQRLYLDADGADVDAGIAMGTMVRGRNLTTIAPLSVDQGSTPVLARQDLTKPRDLCGSAGSCSCRGACAAVWASGAERRGNVVRLTGLTDDSLRAHLKAQGLSALFIAALTRNEGPLDILLVRANRYAPSMFDGIVAACGEEPTQMNQPIEGNLVHFRSEVRRKDAAWRACRTAVVALVSISTSPFLHR